MSALCALRAGLAYSGWGALELRDILVHSEVWEPLMQVPLFDTQEALIKMSSGEPGMGIDLAVATMAGRGKQPRLSYVSGSQPGALWAASWGWARNLPGAQGATNLTCASNGYSGSGGFGADKCCTGKGRGRPFRRGQQSQLPQSIVLSFLQQDARSPAEKGLVCLHSQYNNLLLAFLLGLAQSNRI